MLRYIIENRRNFWPTWAELLGDIIALACIFGLLFMGLFVGLIYG